MYRNIWRKLSYLGLSDNKDYPDKRYIIFTNQLVFIMFLTLGVLDALLFALGIYKAALLLLCMQAGFIGIAGLISLKHYNAARLIGLSLQNLNIFQLSVFIGYEARIIDFLIITSLLPLIIFNVHQKGMMAFCALQSFVLFIVYHAVQPYIQHFFMPVQEQMLIYNLIIPVKFILVLIIVMVLVSVSERERKQAQTQHDELMNQKNYFINILEQLPIDIAIFDLDLRYTYINKHAIRDNQTRSWIIGKSNLDYTELKKFPAQIAEKRDHLLKTAIHQKNVVYMDETFIGQDGTAKHNIKGAAPIRAVDGNVTDLIGFSLDITERKLAEDKLKQTLEELERVNEGLKQFAYVTSHDLKTPLRNIATYLQLLKRKNHLDAESSEMVDHAVKSVKHLNQLISDIFMYTTTDTINKETQTVSVHSVLTQIQLDTKAIMEEKNVQFIIPDSIPKIKINKTHALHLFSNLFSNAIKYNQSDTPLVELKIGSINGYAEFIFKDNGIGIDPKYKDRIFEIFKRLHTSNEYEGTGIGLAICKKIIEGCGGKIDVQSVPGNGTEFIFTLPIVENEFSYAAVEESYS